MAYITKPAESIMGIALRQLANETRWTEIRDLNAEKYPDMVGTDYYPVGTSIEIPEVDPRNISEEGELLLKRLQQKQKERFQAEMIAKRKAEIAVSIERWTQKEKWRNSGPNTAKLVATDPMFAKMTERYQERVLEECYKAFISVPQYQVGNAKDVLRKYLFGEEK